MSARSKARKRALDVLFESELRGLPLGETLSERTGSGHSPMPEYAVRLVEGVQEHRSRIDELVASYSQGWSLERMPAVDRNVLRLGVLELLWVDEVPDAVAVSEALNLVRELSTDESPGFVNGVLGNIVRDKSALSA